MPTPRTSLPLATLLVLFAVAFATPGCAELRHRGTGAEPPFGEAVDSDGSVPFDPDTAPRDVDTLAPEPEDPPPPAPPPSAEPPVDPPEPAAPADPPAPSPEPEPPPADSPPAPPPPPRAARGSRAACEISDECALGELCLFAHPGCDAGRGICSPNDFCELRTIELCGCDGRTFDAPANCVTVAYARAGLCDRI